MPDRAKFIPVDDVSKKVAEIARDVLMERAKEWRVDSVDIGIFPDLGRVGGYLHGGVLREIDAGKLHAVSVELADRVQDVVGGIRPDILFDGDGCTVGGKLDPQIAIGFDQFRP